MLQESKRAALWPSLPYEAWKDTAATLHMWTQIVGKIRLSHEPMVNQWWQVPLYVTARGLTTTPMPLGTSRTFQIDFDFIEHNLLIQDCDGQRSLMPLAPMSVADFYAEVMRRLKELDIPTRICTTPCEVPDPIPFDKDYTHAAYDKEYAHRFWRVLLQGDRLCKRFRSHFTGKVSPVHFFWGGFDLAVTRFSGRSAPEHAPVPNTADSIVQEAYNQEVSSCGFWPGGFGLDALFYAYAYPEPDGFATAARALPEPAYYQSQLHEYVLPYEAVREAADPDAMVLSFFQSTYEAAADLAGWNRPALERH